MQKLAAELLSSDELWVWLSYCGCNWSTREGVPVGEGTREKVEGTEIPSIIQDPRWSSEELGTTDSEVVALTPLQSRPLHTCYKTILMSKQYSIMPASWATMFCLLNVLQSSAKHCSIPIYTQHLQRLVLVDQWRNRATWEVVIQSESRVSHSIDLRGRYLHKNYNFHFRLDQTLQGSPLWWVNQPIDVHGYNLRPILFIGLRKNPK